MGTVVVLGLADDERAHLVRALAQHARWCRANGVPLPSTVRRLLESVASDGQERPNLVAPAEDAHDEPVTLLLDYASAARRLAVSERTLRRLATSGALPTVSVGGCRRIRATDLAAYVEGLG